MRNKRRTRPENGAQPGAARGADVPIVALADRQHGVVARRQLVALGYSSGAIHRRVRRGLLCPVHRGVYAVGRTTLGRRGRWMAAVLACGSEAVLSHRSAAQLWGVFPLGGGFAIEVTRPTSARRRETISAHQARLREDEVARVEGIPATSVARTLFDLAAVVPRRQLERSFHEVEVRRLTDRVSVPILLERHPRCRGAADLRRILASREPAGITESEMEERFLAFLDARGFPPARLNSVVSVGGRILRPDCAWPRQRLIVELDGRAAHDTARAFERDRRRDRELLAAGRRTIRVTWRQLHDEPDAVAADLRRALGTSPAFSPLSGTKVGLDR